MPEIVISDTSPLFYLNTIGLIEILRDLYGNIFIPEAVFSELEEGRKIGEKVPDVKTYPWIDIKSVTSPKYISMVPDLGKGEAEVIALASEYDDPLLIIDDLLGRRIACLKNSRITGTAGILLRAKEKEYISDLKSIIEKLKDSGFYISDSLFNSILDIAGER